MERPRFQFNIGTMMLAVVIVAACSSILILYRGYPWASMAFSVILFGGTRALVYGQAGARWRAEGREPTATERRRAHRAATLAHYAVLIMWVIVICLIRNSR